MIPLVDFVYVITAVAVIVAIIFLIRPVVASVDRKIEFYSSHQYHRKILEKRSAEFRRWENIETKRAELENSLRSDELDLKNFKLEIISIISKYEILKKREIYERLSSHLKDKPHLLNDEFFHNIDRIQSEIESSRLFADK